MGKDLTVDGESSVSCPRHADYYCISERKTQTQVLQDVIDLIETNTSSNWELAGCILKLASFRVQNRESLKQEFSLKDPGATLKEFVNLLREERCMFWDNYLEQPLWAILFETYHIDSLESPNLNDAYTAMKHYYDTKLDAFCADHEPSFVISYC